MKKWLLYCISQFQLLTPSPPGGEFFERAKSRAKKGCKSTAPRAKNHVRKGPKAPPPGQNKNLSFSRNRFLLHKYLKNVLNTKRLGSICFKKNIVTFLLIQFRCLRDNYNYCERQQAFFLLFLLAS